MKEFKEKIIALCREYQVCIVNEDRYCGFEIVPYKEEDMVFVTEMEDRTDGKV